jgi:hypothetical protein
MTGNESLAISLKRNKFLFQSNMDSSRELRAMIMASFPCPPLPMQGIERWVNSHDQIAYLIDVAARRNVASENETRRKLQFQLTNNYIQNIKNCNTEAETWNVMTKFTRDYMMTYHPCMHEARFSSFDAITLPLRKQVCSWLAAQYIMQGDDNVKAENFQNLPVWSLYNQCRKVFCVANDATCNSIDVCNVQNGSSVIVDLDKTAETNKGET